MFSNTDFRTIVNDIGNINVQTSIPAFIPGGDHHNFGIEHRRAIYKQVVLIAYEVLARDPEIFMNNLKQNIQDHLGEGAEVLSYPYSDLDNLEIALEQLAENFNTEINKNQIIKKEENTRIESLGYRLYIGIITSEYYR